MAEHTSDRNSQVPTTTADRGPKVGIALGAGGAKGVAHVPMLEALDELGVTPHRVAGCSIGAVMGALYCSGLSGRDIRDKLERLAVTRSDTVREVFADKKLGRWMSMINPDFRRSGLIKSEAIMAELCENRACETFEDLAVPLAVVATDFRRGAPVVLDSGPLKPAVQASMALPGLFTPVELDGRVLIDGGTVNPVPYDVLMDSCDIVIAVDINSGSAADPDELPGYFSTIFASVQIMQRAIVEHELRARPPHIYIQPDLRQFRTLHYYKADEIYRQAKTAKDQLKRRLAGKLEAWGS